MLQATNLTKRYGRLTALNDVSFSVREGEVLGLIGPNGSGKTTLFECLGGVLPLDGGAVLQNGRPITARDRASDFVQRFFQSGATSPTRNVRYPAPIPAPIPTPSIAEVIEQLDLEVILDSAIGTLSKGQRKRALLASATYRG